VTSRIVLLLALAILAVVPSRAPAQSQLHPRWEIPGFDFRKDGAWRVKARRVAEVRRQLRAQGRMDQLNAPLRAGAQTAAEAAVTGAQLVPALFLGYQGTNASFMRDTAQYSALLFGASPPPGNPYTLTTFYEQLSTSGANPPLFSMLGRIMGWVRLDSAEVTYTGTPGTCSGHPDGQTTCNGLFSSDAIRRMQNGFRQALARVDTGPAGLDFGAFDNDGPDGMPNSGDDDGYVDMIMFAHATRDGACGGTTNNHIWSHRFVFANATQTNFEDYATNDPSAEGGRIRISDYFASSALGGATSCDSTQIMPIGTAAHEFGHALGLPDLYDTQGSTEGIGRWGLMGSGNLSSPVSPARMEAWSLDQLGWIALRELTTGGTYGLGPVPTADTAFLVRPTGANSRGEYFLLENRQAVLADTALIRNACQVWHQMANPPACQGGLLIWHVDQTQVDNGGGFNDINVGAIHGVKLEEADGARDLWCPGTVPLACNRGDAGDPYPGQTGNTAFSFNTNPAAVKNLDGDFVGFALDSIRQIVPDGEMAFRLRFGGLTVVRGSDTNAVIQVDAVNYNVFRDLVDDGVTRTVSVADTQLSFDTRRRWRFGSWSDGGLRTHDITGSFAGTTITAALERDFRLIFTAGTRGTVSSSPSLNSADTLIAEATQIQLTATPNAGFSFAGWSGDTASVNPVITLAMGRPYTVRAVFLAPLSTANVVSQLLSGTGLGAQDTLDLDQLGNNNGRFDVGDFLAWVKATGAP
jgi:M6 family metalloprotease-like protein